MKRTLGVLTICIVVASAAQAGTARWVKEVNTSPAMVVSITSPGYYNGGAWAGVYNLEVADGALPAPPPTGTPTVSFCADLANYSASGWQKYTLTNLEVAPVGGWGDHANDPMGTVKANDIRKLFAAHYLYSGGWTPLTATAFQACVWEIIYESAANAYNVQDGALRVTGNEIEATANTWLAAIYADKMANLLPKDPYVGVLSNPTYQDYAVVTGVGDLPPVPEPLTVASAFFAVFGLGAYIRRRTSVDVG